MNALGICLEPACVAFQILFYLSVSIFFTLQIIAEFVKCMMRIMGRDVPEPDVPEGFE